MTEETIFMTALEKADPAERAAFLGQACGTDAQLRQRVEVLLGAHEKAGPFLNRPAIERPSDRTQVHGTTVDASDDHDDVLAILTPSDQPNSLGRIGHYEVFEVLGRGGFGIVFRAFDDVLKRVVAVKVLSPSMAATSPARKRFLREARSSAQVRHEHVVQVHVVEEQPYPFLVMEFVPGETLQQRVDRKGPLEIGDVLRIGRQIAEGLAAAHATGLIHRDIKPSNVLIEASPQERVKITDFGLARAADDASLTRSGVVAGTPMYMAPEQARGDSLDHRADLFSLGSVLYLMCTGRPPFRASTTFAVLKRVAEESPRPIREVIPEVPEWFCRIVEKLHTKNPDERYQTAREVADVLADCETQLTTSQGLKDFSRIPAKRPTPRHILRSVLALWSIVILFWAALWYGEITFRYFTNRAAIEFVPTEGVVSITVQRNGVPVDPKFPTYGMPRREPISVEPDRYAFTASLAPGWSVDYWIVTTEGFRSARIVWPGDVPLAFTIDRGKNVIVNPVLKVVPTTPPLANDINSFDGFVSLFNGKDLSGWKPFPSDRKSWKVENGLLIGSGRPSHLFSERGDFSNFHLRMETRFKRNVKAGAVGVFARVPFEDPGMNLSPHGEGSLLRTPVPKLYDEKAAPIDPAPPSYREKPLVLWGLDHKGEKTNIKSFPADEWFTHELILDGKHVTVKTDSKDQSSQSFVFAGAPAGSGHLALQLFDDWTVVEFRKIEIKELPATVPSDPKVNPVSSTTITMLQQLVASTLHERNNTKVRFDAGLSSRSDLITMEIELLEARIQLAEAQKSLGEIIKLLEELVTQRQAARDLTETKFKVGTVSAGDLNKADTQLADAKVRLAKAKELPKP